MKLSSLSLLMIVAAAIIAMRSTSGFRLNHRHAKCNRSSLTMASPTRNSDKVRGLGGFYVLATLAVLGQLRSQFSSVELRTTTVCPDTERTLNIYKENDPSFHCLPLDELARRFFTDPLVLPGDPAYDPSFLRIEMRGLKSSTPITRADGSPLQL